MFKLYLDPGHGGSDPGAVANGMQEKNLVLDIARRIRTILINNYQDIEVKMSRTSDTTVSLNERTTEANNWGAHYFLSIHVNSFDGNVRGYEDYIHSSLSDTSETAKYRDIMHEEIIKVANLNNRGKKKANFHVLRETKMPALLTENGFIDNNNDAEKLKDPDWRQRVAEGHVNGLVKAFNLKSKTIFRVIAGSYKMKENALAREQHLQHLGYDTHIIQAVVSNETYYRVQVGAFTNEDNANNLVEKLKNDGVNDVFIVRDDGETNQEKAGEPIMGASLLSGEEMNAFVKKVNPEAPLLGSLYETEGKRYGIRGDVAFAQAIHETGYFRFGGQVRKEQNNFAGIGATNGGESGASFDTPREGVIAHLQHLYAYASKQPLPPNEKLVDPRFNMVERGSAPTWEQLNGKWAVPGLDYGQKILSIYLKMIMFAKEQEDNNSNQEAIKAIEQDLVELKRLVASIEEKLNNLK
ncbi:N-acetylmuramoyl-L-alanine amidase [Halalkalibacter urbisdiaboli]|uniref:N-acetylmuramoyl-L-alanine amidase n=1 Tax=Halalkalibacter urbisdiaboli TaxID=1960589 RepID=UPI000B444B29|nr:N-acetylmuramoyl-L-alanine amidase [Halalkalibacter urbisdiaboli]